MHVRGCSWCRCMVMGRRCGPQRTLHSRRSPSPAWGSKLVPVKPASRSARLARTSCVAPGKGRLMLSRSLMSAALLPSAVRPARTNTSQAVEYFSDPGSGGTAEDACCRYLASRALPDLRLGVLAAALSVLGAALRFFALRSVITMPTHDAWCGMQGSGPCVRESGLCVRELHGNGDLCAGRGSVRRLESATAAVSTGLGHLRASEEP